MNRIQRIAIFSTVSTALLAAPVFGQNRDDRRDDRNDQGYHNNVDGHDGDHHDSYVRHPEWKKGYHMRHEDWDRGQRVEDWRAHHLRQPPRGYEWRQVDGNYVLAAAATGIIASVIAASAAH